MAVLKYGRFLRSTSTASNGDRGGNGQSITCYRQVHQQAYCDEGRGGSRRRRPGAIAGGHAEAQPRANRTTALFAYVGAFTTPERKGHGGGINVYRVDPTSGAWSHEQLLEIANPSFLTLDRAQRFLYS